MPNTGRQSVLVTGGKGLVGTALAELVQQNEGYLNTDLEFVFLSHEEADLTDLEETRRIFIQHSPSYVINLAAKVGGLFANMADNDTFYRLNKAINNNVLQCSKESNVIKCVSCLSTCIFPAEIDYPIDESKIHLGPPHGSNRGYSMAKREVDLLNRQLNSSGCRTLFTAIVPTNIYGPNDNFNLAHSHVIPGLIHKAYLSGMQSRRDGQAKAYLEVCGTGEPLRQFIYVKDLANLILWTLNNYNDSEPLILSPDERDEVSIRYVAEIVAKFMGKALKLEFQLKFDTGKSDGQFKKTASNSKLRALNPRFEFTTIELGLQETVEWFCENYLNIRQ